MKPPSSEDEIKALPVSNRENAAEDVGREPSWREQRTNMIVVERGENEKT
jgi:hypothetical protein